MRVPADYAPSRATGGFSCDGETERGGRLPTESCSIYNTNGQKNKTPCISENLGTLFVRKAKMIFFDFPKEIWVTKSHDLTFCDPIKLMAFRMSSTRPVWGAQINDVSCKSLICKESENDIFRFPFSKKPRMDFLRPYHSREEKLPWTWLESFGIVPRSLSENHADSWE